MFRKAIKKKSIGLSNDSFIIDLYTEFLQLQASTYIQAY